MSKRKKSSHTRDTQTRPATSVQPAFGLGVWAGVAIIVAVALFAYYPCLSGGFILDDDLLLTENKIIKASDGPYQFWCTTEAPEYYPATYTMLWIEWRVWGMNPTGYHSVNLILHVVEALLIWVILRKMSIPGAFLAAVIFAVHPVNVESVAWIAQRRNMLAMLFFLLSILCYLKHSSQSAYSSHYSHPAWYWLSLLTFVLAMLSKGSAAVLPFLLLGMVCWLRTLTRWDLLRSAPFFAVATGLTLMNVWFQSHGEETFIRNANFTERLLGAGGVVWFYLLKALFPIDLIFVYPQWNIETGNPLWWLPLAGVLIVTAVLWRYRKNWSRPLLFAWGFFCVALAPVMGFTDIGYMQYSLVADHYQHIAIIGVIATVSAFWSTWRQHTRDGARRTATVVAIVAVSALTFLTWRQSGIYSDAITLYQSTLAKNPDCYMVHYNLAVALSKAGRTEETIEHYHQALRLKPDYIKALNNLGQLSFDAGRVREAIDYYREALRFNTDHFEIYDNLGIALMQNDQPQEAIECYEQAIRLKPDYPEAYYNLGYALSLTGRPQDAVEHYRQAVNLKPDYVDAHNNLGIVLVRTGRPGEAIEHYRQALALKPDFANAYANLAWAYATMSQSSEAIAAAQKALELARSQGQTALARQIDDWLISYRAGLSKQE